MHRTAGWMLVLMGCAGGTPGGPRGPVGGDDTLADTGSSGTTPAIELACDDAIDDDLDGDVDCDDADCTAEVHCGWPEALALRTEVAFDANILAELGGYGDCGVVTTSMLARARGEEPTCPDCERVFCGDFAYPMDDCPKEPGAERPDSGCFGFRFGSETAWTLLGRNPETEQWSEVGVLTGPGPLFLSDTQPLEVEGTEVGTLTTSFQVSEP